METSVHFHDPVSRWMVRQVVAQGQWKSRNKMVQRAVCQAQPWESSSVWSASPETSISTALPLRMVTSSGRSSSLAGKDRSVRS